MLLKDKTSRHLVAVVELTDLVNPYITTVQARPQWGEEEQDPESFSKEDLSFPSGEDLPRCWCDEHYRDDELVARRSGESSPPK